MEELVKAFKASLFLSLYQADEAQLGVKKEVILVKAGFSYKETADILNKSEAAVQKSVSRARLAEKKEKSDE